MAYTLKKSGVLFLRYLRENTGATAIEYALLVAFISVFIIGAVLAIGGDLEAFYTTILDYLNSVQ